MAMTNEDYQHFVCIVAGDDYEKLMAKYDKNMKVDKYIVYKYDDRESLKTKYQIMLEELMNNKDISRLEKKEIEYALEDIRNEDAEDFFWEFTCDYEHDSDTHDAISMDNKDGKWTSYNIGQLFSVPFMLKDSREVFHAKKGDIAWDMIHKKDVEIYKRTWELCMEGEKPQNELEKQLLENMHGRNTYFKKFETKENYVDNCTSFWGYAFLSEETGWVELEPNMNQFDWVRNFYDRFIVPLSDDTELTIIECRR